MLSSIWIERKGLTFPMKRTTVSRQNFLKATGAGILATSVPLTILKPAQATASSSPGTITQMTEAGSTWTAFFKAKAPAFKKKTGITVNFVEVDFTDLYVKEQLALTTGQGSFDVMAMPGEWTWPFASAKLLTPIDELITADDKADFVPAALKKANYHGHYYGRPILAGTEALFYRTDLFRDAGITPPTVDNPWSWDQYLNAAVKLTKPPLLYGTSIKAAKYSGSTVQFADFLYQAGNGADGMFDRNGHVVVGNSKGVQAIDYWVSLLKKHAVPPGVLTYTETEVQTGFMNGNLAMSLNWNYMYSLAADRKQSRVAGKFGVGPIFQGNRAGSWLGGWVLAVPLDSPKKDLAKEWISWVLSAEMHREMVLTFDPEPVRMSVLTDKKVLAQLPYLRVWRTLYEQAFTAFQEPAINNVILTVAGLQQQALTGQLSPRSAVQAMGTQISKELKPSM